MEVEIKNVEVILKKTKISSTILKQTIKTTYSLSKNKNYEILGWCLYNNIKTAVFYNKNDNTIKKCELYTNIMIKDNILILKFQSKDNNDNYTKSKEYKDINQLNEDYENLKSIHKNIIDKGQFYI
ncbi:hypothetical protein [Faecalibacter bovis]|uniref:Uncharacterized protein n=1 Tax=Faecalibacter bovis TaxID=2898187 RepID=A0ABX7XBR9_9FLAO|nr:hypothetical protein [Faecalibacter bovis]QTV05366.1 hypothetical protein J9309_11400 [Faecalibacter bovis]